MSQSPYWMQIDTFGFSDQCLTALKRAGFTSVEEIVEFLEEHGRENMPLVAWLPGCFEEIRAQFKERSYWSEKLAQSWPSF